MFSAYLVLILWVCRSPPLHIGHFHIFLTMFLGSILTTSNCFGASSAFWGAFSAILDHFGSLCHWPLIRVHWQIIYCTTFWRNIFQWKIFFYSFYIWGALALVSQPLWRSHRDWHKWPSPIAQPTVVEMKRDDKALTPSFYLQIWINFCVRKNNKTQTSYFFRFGVCFQSHIITPIPANLWPISFFWSFCAFPHNLAHFYIFFWPWSVFFCHFFATFKDILSFLGHCRPLWGEDRQSSQGESQGGGISFTSERECCILSPVLWKIGYFPLFFSCLFGTHYC